MAMEIPSIIPPGNHPDFKSLEQLPVKSGQSGRRNKDIPLDIDIKETRNYSGVATN